MLVAAISTTAESPENIRRWIAYHRRLGVARFYLFVTGTAALPGEARALEQEPGVVLYRPQHDEQLQVGLPRPCVCVCSGGGRGGGVSSRLLLVGITVTTH